MEDGNRLLLVGNKKVLDFHNLITGQYFSPSPLFTKLGTFKNATLTTENNYKYSINTKYYSALVDVDVSVESLTKQIIHEQKYCVILFVFDILEVIPCLFF
jgi:hypothetical protein